MIYKPFTKTVWSTGPENIGLERTLLGLMARAQVNNPSRTTFEIYEKSGYSRIRRHFSQGTWRTNRDSNGRYCRIRTEVSHSQRTSAFRPSRRMLHLVSMASVGSDRTDALQHRHQVSWRSECPLPEQVTSTLASAANVRKPPISAAKRLTLQVGAGLPPLRGPALK